MANMFLWLLSLTTGCSQWSLSLRGRSYAVGVSLGWAWDLQHCLGSLVLCVVVSGFRCLSQILREHLTRVIAALRSFLLTLR